MNNNKANLDAERHSRGSAGDVDLAGDLGRKVLVDLDPGAGLGLQLLDGGAARADDLAHLGLRALDDLRHRGATGHAVHVDRRGALGDDQVDEVRGGLDLLGAAGDVHLSVHTVGEVLVDICSSSTAGLDLLNDHSLGSNDLTHLVGGDLENQEFLARNKRRTGRGSGGRVDSLGSVGNISALLHLQFLGLVIVNQIVLLLFSLLSLSLLIALAL